MRLFHFLSLQKTKENVRICFLMNLISHLGKYDCIKFLLIWQCHLLISFYSILAIECKEIQKSVCEGEVINRGVFT